MSCPHRWRTMSWPEGRISPESLVDALAASVRAPREALTSAVACLLAGGHLLIEDVPGVGKTVLAKSLARAAGCVFSRLQCTADLLPSDVTGVHVYDQRSQTFEFRPGPVFANILLADEINRASPKTQSALLESMEEAQVTVDGHTRQLPRPFMVVATMNPVEYEGTFPLPEAQLDRFALRLTIGYPPAEQEARMIIDLASHDPVDDVTAVADDDADPRCHRRGRPRPRRPLDRAVRRRSGDRDARGPAIWCWAPAHARGSRCCASQRPSR